MTYLYDYRLHVPVTVRPGSWSTVLLQETPFSAMSLRNNSGLLGSLKSTLQQFYIGEKERQLVFGHTQSGFSKGR